MATPGPPACTVTARAPCPAPVDTDLPYWVDVHKDRGVSKQPELVQLGERACAPTVMTARALTAEAAAALAVGFKAVGDPTRLRLLSLIAAHDGGEACVCDLTHAFPLSGPTISHHLKVLREAGLITGDRRGTWVYYRIVPDALAALSRALSPAASDLEVSA